MEFWTAFTIGLFGSLHCIGMCGPIALTLPYQDSTKIKTLLNVLLYNLGRTFSYTLIGIIPGLLGLGLFISGYQSGLSVILGILMIGIALFSLRTYPMFILRAAKSHFKNLNSHFCIPITKAMKIQKRFFRTLNFAFSLSKIKNGQVLNIEQQILSISWYKRFNNWLRSQFSRQLQKRNRSTLLSIGLLNGLLPCGMVYVAVAGAITQAHVIDSMLYMMFFGLGTMPLMLFLSLSGNWISGKFRKQLFKMVPIVILLFGVFFLWRGLEVDLPSNINWLILGKQTMCH